MKGTNKDMKLISCVHNNIRTYLYIYMYTHIYHQQQNIWYAKGIYLPISKLHTILAVASLLTHDKITISYFMQVNSSCYMTVVVLLMILGVLKYKLMGCHPIERIVICPSHSFQSSFFPTKVSFP